MVIKAIQPQGEGTTAHMISRTLSLGRGQGEGRQGNRNMTNSGSGAATWRIGVDVGGTFTDLVMIDGAGETFVFKAPSVPADPASGVIAASGTLAILMPPSIMLIILSDQLGVGVGDLFAASIVPALILICLYLAYVLIRAHLRPDEAPMAPRSGDVRIGRILLGIGPLVLLIFCVLGSIIFGIASPTEASGVGALGAALLVAANGRLTRARFSRVAVLTVRNTTAVLFLAIGATCFSAVFRGVGGEDMIVDWLEHMQVGAWGTLIILMVAMIVMGFFLDWLEIVLILLPIFGPVVAGLDFGNGLSGNALMVWFAIIVAVNLQTSFLTPPFGFSLFYIRNAAQGALTNRETYAGVMPYIGLQLLTLLIVLLWPSILI